MCPVEVSLSKTVRLKKSEVEGGSLSPERRKRQPKQTQISCALLRRQGAEHGVLVDATKPLKTNLPPSLLPSYLSYPWHSVYIDIIPWRHPWLNINAHSQVMIRPEKTVIVFITFLLQMIMAIVRLIPKHWVYYEMLYFTVSKGPGVVHNFISIG